MDYQVKKDNFCWSCHEIGTSITSKMRSCSNCVRSFHLKCLKGKPQVDDIEWQCPECLTQQNRTLDTEPLKHLLKRIYLYDGVRLFEFINAESDKIINPICLNDIKRKTLHGEYNSLDDFLSDIKWINHYCHIYYRGSTNYGKLIEITEYLVEYSTHEINSIKLCAECYMNANSTDQWFTMVCSQPHLLLWVKWGRSPYWPAKLMSSSGSRLHVRFFGKYEYADVPLSKCLLYSEPVPAYKRKTSAAMSKKVDEAKQEADIYNDNLKAKFDPTQLEAMGQQILMRPHSRNVSSTLTITERRADVFDDSLVFQYPTGGLKTILKPRKKKERTLSAQTSPTTAGTKRTSKRSQSVRFDLEQNQIFEENVVELGGKRPRLDETFSEPSTILSSKNFETTNDGKQGNSDSDSSASLTTDCLDRSLDQFQLMKLEAKHATKLSKTHANYKNIIADMEKKLEQKDTRHQMVMTEMKRGFAATIAGIKTKLCARCKSHIPPSMGFGPSRQ